MLILFAFQICYSINITQFSNFQINLDASPTEYFMLTGPHDSAYLYQRDFTQFQLYLIQNNSYELYTSPYENVLIFEWPQQTINKKAMVLFSNNGSSIVHPMKFNDEIFMSQINALTVGVDQGSTLEKSYKCLPSGKWLIDVLACIISFLLLSILGFNRGFIETLLGPRIAHLFQRIRRNSPVISSQPAPPDTIHSEQFLPPPPVLPHKS